MKLWRLILIIYELILLLLWQSNSLVKSYISWAMNRARLDVSIIDEREGIV